jgi:hypothetical protein
MFSGVVLVAAGVSKLAVDFLAARGAPAVIQAVVVFVLATLVWSPWLWPYAADLLRRLEARHRG